MLLSHSTKDCFFFFFSVTSCISEARWSHGNDASALRLKKWLWTVILCCLTYRSTDSTNRSGPKDVFTTSFVNAVNRFGEEAPFQPRLAIGWLAVMWHRSLLSWSVEAFISVNFNYIQHMYLPLLYFLSTHQHIQWRRRIEIQMHDFDQLQFDMVLWWNSWHFKQDQPDMPYQSPTLACSGTNTECVHFARTYLRGEVSENIETCLCQKKKHLQNKNNPSGFWSQNGKFQHEKTQKLLQFWVQPDS